MGQYKAVDYKNMCIFSILQNPSLQSSDTGTRCLRRKKDFMRTDSGNIEQQICRNVHVKYITAQGGKMSKSQC